ncbi:MAG: phosphoglyceromutase [Oleiphilus sp.]|nr:MAG: phosphoglyceromutase [Oleiphilus sp.]
MTTIPVILIRHAQSTWNSEHRFTGWADPPLTEAGVNEAIRAGKQLASQKISFDVCFSSPLRRAKRTADIILQHTQRQSDSISIIEDWRLSERHYGALQGKDKLLMAQEVGEQQVWRWRRGYADLPPALALSDERHPKFQTLFQNVPSERLPCHESLADTEERVMTCWLERVVPYIREGQRLLISSHGNTLRALIKSLSNMSIQEVEQFEIPTGRAIVYHFNQNDAKPLSWHYFDDKTDAPSSTPSTITESK